MKKLLLSLLVAACLYTYTVKSPVELGERIWYDGGYWYVVGILVTKGEPRLLITGEDGVLSIAVSNLKEEE